MLQFFPKFYPDELLYSVLARFSKIRFYENPQALNKCLFKYARLRATIDLPGHLRKFQDMTYHILHLDTDELISSHTLYPFYRPFLSNNKRVSILESMTNDFAGNIHTRVGINASRLTRERFPKYCLDCFHEDLNAYRESYWHRVHQIPGIVVCPYHNIHLEEYIPKLNELDFLRYVSPPDSLPDSKRQPNEIPLRLIIARKLKDHLFAASEFDINTVDYKKEIIQACFNKGKSIDRNKLTTSFIGHFGEESLKSISAEIGSDYDWLIQIIRKPQHIFNPVRHVLMCLFIESLKTRHSIKSLFNPTHGICLNRASDHYLQNVVTNVSSHIDTKSKKTISVFKCECGMVYTKSFIQSNNSSPKEFTRISNWGEVWNDRLIKEHSSKKSLRKIAKILGTDAKTVSLQLKKLLRNDSPSVEIKNNNESLHKENWLRFLQRHPEKGVKNARQALSQSYKWLYTYEHNWLLKINKQYRKQTQNQKKIRLNWKTIDLAILSQLQAATEKLRKENFKGRISKTILAKIIKREGYLFRTAKSRLPSSQKFLTANSESYYDYKRRRVLGSITDLTKSGLPIKKWRIIKASGFRTPISRNTDKMIQSIIKAY